MQNSLMGAGKGGGGSFTQKPDTLRSNDTFEGLLGLCAGPISGPIRGLKSIRVNGTPIEGEDGTLNFPNFAAAMADGDPLKFPQTVPLQLGAGGSPEQIGVNIRNDPAAGGNPWVTRTINSTNADAIDLRFVVNNLFRQTAKGIYENTLNLELEMKPVGTTTWINPFASNGNPLPAYSEQGFNQSTKSVMLKVMIPEAMYAQNVQRQAGTGLYLTIRGKTTSPYVHELRIAVPNEGVYADKGWDIRVRLRERESYDSPEGTKDADKVTERRIVQWESMTAVYNEALGDHEDWRGLAWLKIFGKASDNFNGLPDIDGIYDTKIVSVPNADVYDAKTRLYTGTIWDGSWSKAFSRDPAWVINDAISDSISGIAAFVPGASLNKWDALELSKWASELVPDGAGGTHPRYSMDLYVDQPQKADEFIRYLAGAVGATAWDNGDGEWRLKVDKPEAPSNIFTHENIEGEFLYSHTDVDTRFNDVTVVFLNEEFDYREDRVRVQDFADIELNGRKPTQVVAVGCTHRQQALRLAILRLRTNINEKRMVTFQTNRQGKYLERFDTILIADGSLDSHNTTGRVIAKSADGLTITVRDPVRLELGVTYKLIFTIPNPAYDPNPVAEPTDPTWDQPSITLHRMITNTAEQRGDVTVLHLDGSVPADMPENAVVALDAPGLPTLPKAYRVVDVGYDDDGERVSVNAMEIDSGKWAAADNASETQLEIEKPVYTIPKPQAPADGQMFHLDSYVTDGGVRRVLTVRWERPIGRYTTTYNVRYRVNEGPWRLLDETADTTIELHYPDAGVYEFEVTANDRRGRVSQPLSGAFELPDTLDIPPAATLTNEAALVYADYNGNVTDLSDATGSFFLNNATGVIVDGVSYYVKPGSSVGGLTATIDQNGFYTATGLAADQGSITFVAEYGDFVMEKVFSVAKSRAGAPGANGQPGAPAKGVSVNADIQTVPFTAAGAPVNPAQVITFRAERKNTTAAVNWNWVQLGTNNAVVDGAVLTVAPDGLSATVTHADFDLARGNTEGVIVLASCDGFIDRVSVVRAQRGATGAAGAPTFVGVLSNETHTIPADKDGVVLDYTGAGGQFYVYLGSANVTADCSFEKVADSPSTMDCAISAGGAYAVTGNLTTDTGYADFRATHTPTGQKVTKRFTFSKSKTGATGATGQAALTAVLTNEHANVTAAADGSNVFIGDTTNGFIRVFLGTQEVTNDCSFTVPSSSGNAGIDINNADNDPVNQAPKGFYRVNSMSGAGHPDTAWFDIQIAYPGYPAITKRFTVAKARAGATGAKGDAGADAKLLTLVATANTQVYTAAGVAKQQTIKFTARKQNTSGEPLFEIYDLNNVGQMGLTAAQWVANYGAAYGFTSDGPDNLNINEVGFANICAWWTGSKGFSVGIALNGLGDRQSVVRVDEGSSALNGYLTNENHGLPADKDGNILSVDGAGGYFKVMLGTDDVTANCTFTKGSSSGLVLDAYIGVQSDGYIYMSSAGAMAAATNVAWIDIVAKHTPTGQTITKRMTWVKSKTGSTGDAAKLVTVTASHQTFSYASGANAPTAQVTTFTMLPTNPGTDTAYWTIRKPDGAAIAGMGFKTATQLAGTGAFTRVDDLTIQMNQTQFHSLITGYGVNGLIIEVSYGGATAIKDQISVTAVKDGVAGANAKSIQLNAQQQTMKYDTAGKVVAGQSITIEVQKKNLSTATVQVNAYVIKADGTTAEVYAGMYVGGTGTITTSGNGYTMTGNSLSVIANDFNNVLAAGGADSLGMIVEVSADGFSDRVSIMKVRDGSSGAWTPVTTPGLQAIGTGFKRVDSTGDWDRQVYSKEKVRGRKVSFRFANVNYLMVGLNSDPELTPRYENKDYVIYGQQVGQQPYVYESGNGMGYHGSVVSTDTIYSVEQREDVVFYCENGTPFFVSQVQALAPLHFDSSFLSVNGEIQDVSVGLAPALPPFYTVHRQCITYGESTWTKSAGGNGWVDGTVISSKGYAGAMLSFTCPASASDFMIGFSRTRQFNKGYNYISHAINFTSSPTTGGYYAETRVDGAAVTSLTPWNLNDTITWRHDGDVITVLKNGQVWTTFEASTITLSQKYYAMADLYTDGMVLRDIAFSQAGLNGTRPDVKFIRSAAQPATPASTEDNPVGWSDGVPGGTGRLWTIRGTKTYAGKLVGNWSIPASLNDIVSRGAYNPSTTYFVYDQVTYNGGTYICVAQTTGNAPSGTAQGNAYWDVAAAPGATGAAGGSSPPAGFSTTINLTSASSVNLRSLADAAGYPGGDATINFVVPNGVVIRGIGGANSGLPGGKAIDTGSWPAGKTLALTLTINAGGIVDGGGGAGGDGASSGGEGGDAVFLRVPLNVTNNGTLRGGGGGGGGGRYQNLSEGGSGPQRPYIDADSGSADGGGGGQPNGGPGFPQGDGQPGQPASVTSPGLPRGGAYGLSGGNALSGGLGGAAGYAVRKNGYACTVTNNGTLAGATA